MSKKSWAALALGLCLQGLPGPARGGERERKDPGTAVKSGGLYGNVASIAPDTPGVFPGIAGSMQFTGNARALTDTFNCRRDCGSEKVFVRMGASGQAAFLRRDGVQSDITGVQARFAAGVLEKNRVYYAPSVNVDYDGVVRKGDPQKAVVSVAGGELGKAFSFGESAVYAGVYSGIGSVSVQNGRMLNEEGDLVNQPMQNSASMAVGASLEARFGKAGRPGTVYVRGTATLIEWEGHRGDLAADVKAGRRVQVGAGVREAAFANGGQRPVRIVTPFVRVGLAFD